MVGDFIRLAATVGGRYMTNRLSHKQRRFVAYSIPVLAVLAALYLPDMPAFLMVPAVLMAGIIGGALWGWIPGGCQPRSARRRRPTHVRMVG